MEAKQINVIIIDDEFSFREILEEFIMKKNREDNIKIKVIFSCEGGQEALNFINNMNNPNDINIITLDLQMKIASGGLLFISELQKIYPYLVQKIMVISASVNYQDHGSMSVCNVLKSLGVSIIPFGKPCDFSEILQNILIYGLIQVKSESDETKAGMLKILINPNNTIEGKIKKILEEKYSVIIDDNKITTQYLYEAILLTYEMRDNRIFILKKIYDKLAKKFDTKAHNIEVAITNIIKEKIDETMSVKIFMVDFINKMIEESR